MNWQIPARHNPKLRALVDAVSADVELMQLYDLANINAVDRYLAVAHIVEARNEIDHG